MTKTTARSYLLMLAIAVITTAALLVWGFAATPAYADEPTDIDKIVFDDDASYDWVHIYAVEGQLGSWDVDQLNIVILNRAGVPIEPNEYDLSFEYVYYDENQGFDVKEPTVGPFGINERDQKQEKGFSEYQVKATPKSTSGIGGEAEANFMIADKHSLNYICPEITFENYAEKDGWRMHDRYWYNPDSAITYSVKNCTGEALQEGIEYNVTYYYRTGSPEDMDDPNKGFEDILVANEENMVKDGEGNPVAPTEPGAYFARIEGADPYYGGNDVLIDITDNIPIIVKEIKLEKTEECDLWSDEMLTYDVVLPEGTEGAPLRFIIGVRGEDDWDIVLSEGSDSWQYFEYKEDTHQLCLKGSKIFEAIGERHLDIYVNAKNQGGEVIAEGFAGVWCRESICDYGLPEDDNILPGWDGWIDSKVHAWVRNKDNPGGKDVECGVIDVEPAADSPDWQDVLEFKKNEDGWSYKGIAPGTVKLEMAYYGEDGTIPTHTFNVNVSQVVYHVDMWSETGVYQGLPGTGIELQAKAVKHTAMPEGDGWRHDSTSDGLNLSWSFEDPDSTRFAEMEVSDDPAKATVFFKDIDEEWIDERIGVRVGVTDEESTPSIERASNRTDLFMRSEYYQIWPATIDGSLDVGKITVLEPEVRFYRYGHDGYSAVEDPRFTVEDFDPEAVDIDYDSGDDCFYIIRKADWDTNFNIRANFDTDDGNESIDQWYHLDRKNYRIEFEYEFDHMDIYADQDLTVKLNKEDLDGLEPELEYGLADDEGMGDNKYAVKYTVGVWNDEDEKWDYKVPRYGHSENLRNFDIDSEGITFYGENLETALAKAREDLGLSEDQLHGFNVRAELIIAGKDYGDSWFWINFRHMCEGEHKWITSTIREKTCIDKGRQVWICLDHPTWGGCGQVRWFDYAGETDDFGPHALTKIPAKASTLTATGNIEHYKCKVCDKLFSDAAGTKQITQASTVIAKKINISGATIAKIPNKTYNKKAQKPALTVKYGTKTLKSGTDYTAAYSNNTNAGTAKVTITGKGLYAGTKTTTFVIVKAANTMTLKPKAVTVKAASVAKANQTVKQATACTVTSPQGKVTWKKASGNAKITVASNGNITVKKGLKKGTYKVGVKATAAGNTNYKAITKSATITIYVK